MPRNICATALQLVPSTETRARDGSVGSGMVEPMCFLLGHAELVHGPCILLVPCWCRTKWTSHQQNSPDLMMSVFGQLKQAGRQRGCVPEWTSKKSNLSLMGRPGCISTCPQDSARDRDGTRPLNQIHPVCSTACPAKNHPSAVVSSTPRVGGWW